jgi:preprotein translocase subunit SecA
MLDKVNREVLSFLFKGALPSQTANQISEAREQKREKLELRKDAVQNSSQLPNAHPTQVPKAQETVVREERKIGRNERVAIKNVISGENKEIKYKQAIPLLEKGEWVLVEN